MRRNNNSGVSDAASTWVRQASAWLTSSDAASCHALMHASCYHQAKSEENLHLCVEELPHSSC